MIELRQVYAGYGGGNVLCDISAQFEPGKVTAVIGPNGCGKSTMLKTVAGIRRPSSGEILCDGKSQVVFSDREWAREVAYLPQSRNIPEITAERMVLHGRFPYLSYPRRYRKEDRERVRDALRQVGAETLAGEMVGSLSGGQRQKVYIAMALAQDTGTVLMDEPTTWLDIKNQIEILELMKKLAENGKCVVAVLHDLDAVLQYADQVILMHTGKIIADASPMQVCGSPEIEKVFGVKIEIQQTGESRHCYAMRADDPV
ncbi:MAG: ABC transporter ATP-binding protein [Clostridiales bacterium]|nr:ABC transporter ATP-binding protein [Clostridiales bacterium]